MARQVAFLQWKPVKILTLSRHVLDIIRYVALFYVIHVIHWLLKYVSGNDKYSKVWRILFVWHSFEKNTRYMKLFSRTRCWRWDLIATIISIFFKKESTIFGFVIDSDHATFNLKYPDRVYFYIDASICFFNFFWNSVFGNDIFDFLPEFSANIFFLPYHVCKQFILSFQTLQTIFFFNISHAHPLQKNNGPSVKNLEYHDCLLLLMLVYRRLRQGNLSNVRVCQV